MALVAAFITAHLEMAPSHCVTWQLQLRVEGFLEHMTHMSHCTVSEGRSL